ncbi:hypothetical protein MJO28_003720 [Puccinia striiformis f. sp. tritici]|uniref:Acyl carrier protein n=3 Tax=Puccinia striiformis TaxID=27350 RepID=A0A0L0URP6_9BASI|nr:hypothetical protein Pst134EA_007670 [Puccinia striiformis f. sp. tritici]KAI9610989.1 hypothetical protein H4Q26_008836 [Puccinia striiformis f. sp. tritici PST-130]KNE89762.1 hypothetical protein PSTG_16795 [Puccinia striiformis f. sp. tritici PST-78]POW10851.1 hypothetical protein PSTT_05810 [Puccinia striiformis]KAH9460596.1 hypothetical protein Pst134EB_008761 [Puccinia striiformis f. sp. tritici]KAH9470412.1 hypothetical protein Pst134EA_007670 [Puccinia striiformis f. sp. tritici]
MALIRYALRSRSFTRPAVSKINVITKFAAYSTRVSTSQPLSSSSRSTVPQFSHAVNRPTINLQSVRFSSGGPLSKEDIQRRILEVLGSFEKCDPAKITPTASFTSDLGLDSLDAVEVVMAIEEEFTIEIPDEEADQITTVSEAISYIERTPEAI